MAALILLFACGEYPLRLGAAPEAPSDTGAPESGHDSPAPPTEACNGEDDDDDGEVDEGFDDLDGDGAKDCVDTACPIGEEEAIDAETVCADGTATVDAPWSARVLWQVSADGMSMFVRPASSPLVARVRDHDGDGDLDADDALDVVAITTSLPNVNLLMLVHGPTGEVHWTGTVPVNGGTTHAVADVDGDGWPEIMAFSPTNELLVFDGEGDLLWSTDPIPFYMGGTPAVTVADLDGDGVAEILADSAVVDGRTGEVRFSLDTEAIVYASPHTAADLDGDGSVEVIYAGALYDAAGGELWEADGARESVAQMVLDTDADGTAEVILAGGGHFRVRTFDGNTTVDEPLAVTPVGSLCGGDLDGDGTAEVVVPDQASVTAFSADGTSLWSDPVATGYSGCAVFDFDGDGAAEVIYASTSALYVLDGCTGDILLEDDTLGAAITFGTPVVADLDEDGHAEVLLANADDDFMGFTALTHDGEGWPSAGSWPIHDFATGRVDDFGACTEDGTWWRTDATLRGVAPVSPAVDLAVVAGETCTSGCAEVGLTYVAVQVENQGAAYVTGATFTFSQAGTTLGEVEVPPLGPGDRSASFTMAAPAGEVVARVSAADDANVGNDATTFLDPCD